VRTDVRSDEVDTNPYRSSYWSYVGLTLTSSIRHDLPLWYYRGLAEVFSNTIVRNKDVLVGPVLPWHLERLRDRQPLRLEELFAVTRQSPDMRDGDRMAHFDASAWALLHYLTFGNGGRNLEAFNRFSIAVGSGAEPGAALADAFGGLAAVESGYRQYVGKSLYMYKQLDLDVNVDPTAFAARALPAPESDVALARYLAATDRPVEARARVASALSAAPGSGAAYEVEGLLLDREDKRAEALAAYTKAADLGGGTYYADFRFASLAWPQAPDVREPFPRMEKSLRRAIERRPTFAPAHALLANVLLELDRAADALPVAQRAVALDAFESYHQLTLARSLRAVGRASEALAPARHARALARSPFDVGAAERFLALLGAQGR
jgi:tetratricopeptide (TPR) repeat protein